MYVNKNANTDGHSKNQNSFDVRQCQHHIARATSQKKAYWKLTIRQSFWSAYSAICEATDSMYFCGWYEFYWDRVRVSQIVDENNDINSE